MVNCEEFHLTDDFPTRGQLIAAILQPQFQLKIKSWGGKILQLLIEVKIDIEHIFMHMI